MVLPVNKIPSTKNFKYYNLGTESSLDYSASYYELKYSQPVSNSFFRLNILPLNHHFTSTSFDTEVNTCTNTNTLVCGFYKADDNSVTEYSVLCNSDTGSTDYIMVWDASNKSASLPDCSNTTDTTDCSSKTFCSLKKIPSNDIKSTCDSDNTKRWFENKCISKYQDNSSCNNYTCSDNDLSNIYSYGGMYYSHQITTPDLVLNFPVQNTVLISFWFFPEVNANFKKSGFNETSKNYIFYSDNIRIYYMEGKIIGELKDSNNTIRTTSSSTSLVNSLGKSWFNFIIRSDSTSTFFAHGIINVGTDNEQKVAYSNSISRICFTSSSCGFNNSNDFWYPGYYRNIEVYSNDDVFLYKSFRAVFNLYEENKYLLSDNYPYNNNLVSYYRMLGWNADIADTDYSITLSQNYVIRNEITMNTSIEYSQLYSGDRYFNFGYEFENQIADIGKYSDDINNTTTPDLVKSNCSEGFSDVCYKCKLDSSATDYSLSFDQNCIPLLDYNYFRSPSLTNDDMILKFTAPSNNKLMFSTFVKIVSIRKLDSSEDSVLITIPGSFKILYNHTNTNIRMICFDSSNNEYACSDLIIFSPHTFFSRWINLSMKLDFSNANKVAYIYVDLIKYKFEFTSNVSISSTNDKIIFSSYISGLINTVYYLSAEVTDFNDMEIEFVVDTNTSAIKYYNEGDSGSTVSCSEFGYSNNGDANCKIRQCIKSTDIHDDFTTANGKYMCVRDYEKEDDFCVIEYHSYISKDNESIQVQEFDFFSDPIMNLHAAYYFGLEDYDDLISGIKIQNIDVSAIIFIRHAYYFIYY